MPLSKKMSIAMLQNNVSRQKVRHSPGVQTKHTDPTDETITVEKTESTTPHSLQSNMY